MEKPWMPGLLDALQSHPPKDSMREAVSEYAHVPEAPPAPEAEQPAFPTPFADSSVDQDRSDTFARLFNSPVAPPSRPAFGYSGNTPWDESWTDRLVAHAPTITIIVLFVAGLAVLSFFYRVQVGQSLIRIGEKLSGQPAQESAMAIPAPPTHASPAQPAAPPLVSAATQQPVSPPNPSAANVERAATSPVDSSTNSQAATNPSVRDSLSSGARDSSAQTGANDLAPPVSAAPANGQAEFQLAHASLSKASTPAEKARAAELLWAAVSKGSSYAEVELADVYATGAGVGKNCQQARILLSAATESHNPLAADESAKLRGYGCR